MFVGQCKFLKIPRFQTPSKFHNCRTLRIFYKFAKKINLNSPLVGHSGYLEILLKSQVPRNTPENSHFLDLPVFYKTLVKIHVCGHLRLNRDFFKKSTLVGHSWSIKIFKSMPLSVSDFFKSVFICHSRCLKIPKKKNA